MQTMAHQLGGIVQSGHKREFGPADVRAHGHTQLEHGVGGLVVHLVDAGVAAGQDHALELTVLRVFANPLVGHIARVHFAVHMGLAHTAGDELGDLRAEIKDEDFLVLHGGRQKGA